MIVVKNIDPKEKELPVKSETNNLFEKEAVSLQEEKMDEEETERGESVYDRDDEDE